MTSRMPVLREDNGVKLLHECVHAGDNCITFGYGKCAAWTKVILNINDYECFIIFSHCLICDLSMLFYRNQTLRRGGRVSEQFCAIKGKLLF